jgi:hypothetical protein
MRRFLAGKIRLFNRGIISNNRDNTSPSISHAGKLSGSADTKPKSEALAQVAPVSTDATLACYQVSPPARNRVMVAEHGGGRNSGQIRVR